MHVPSELAARPNWIVWKTIQRRGHATKLPFNPMTRLLASTTNPATWATLAQARTAMATGEYAGLGFVFGKDDCVFGVDLDSCMRSLFDVEPWAATIIRGFDTYAEISPSRAGVKLFGIGEHQKTGCIKLIDEARPGEKRAAIEVYGWGRFFAFTGSKLDNVPSELKDCRRALKCLIQAITPVRDPAPPPARIPSPQGHERTKLERGRLYLHKVPPATAGQGGHNRTFRAACVLVRDIGLSGADAYDLLREWNERCSPPWSEKELWHKISDAQKPK